MVALFNTDGWALGRLGEQQIRMWLERHGFGVISLANIQDAGAPSLTTQNQRIVLPDFQVAVAGVTRYVEVKTKSKATQFKKDKSWWHGIEIRLYKHYLQIARKTGLEVWLCIYETETPLVLLQNTESLYRNRREYGGPNMPNGQPFVFFLRDEFLWYLGPSAIDLPILKPHAARTLEQDKPPTQKGPTQPRLWDETNK